MATFWMQQLLRAGRGQIRAHPSLEPADGKPSTIGPALQSANKGARAGATDVCPWTSTI